MCGSNFTYFTVRIVHSRQINILYYLELSIPIGIVHTSYYLLLSIGLRHSSDCGGYSFYSTHRLPQALTTFSQLGGSGHHTVLLLFALQWHTSCIHVMQGSSEGKLPAQPPSKNSITNNLIIHTSLCV